MWPTSLIKMKKSQVSTEFMFFVSAGFVLLAVYLIIAYNYLNLTLERRDIISALDLLEELRNEFNLASRIENGYTRIITLPSDINNEQYDIDIDNRALNINFKDIDYARLLATSVNVDKNNNELYFNPGDEIFITKINNEVYVDLTCDINAGDPIKICSETYPNNCENGCKLRCENGIRVWDSTCGINSNGCSDNRLDCSNE